MSGLSTVSINSMFQSAEAASIWQAVFSSKKHVSLCMSGAIKSVPNSEVR